MNKRNKQRFGRRFSEEKLYDLCDYLIADALVNLKAFNKYHGSIPSFLCDEDYEKTDVKKAEKEWHEILNKMIWSMEEYKNDNHNDPGMQGKSYDSDERKEYLKRYNEGFELYGKYLPYLWL